MPRRFAPRNDMQKLAACPHNTRALPVYCRKASLHPLPPGMFPRTLRTASLHPRTRPSFCMSLRTSAHTGVAIRVPAAIPGKSVVLRANSSCFSDSPKVLLLVLPHCKENGLPRRGAAAPLLAMTCKNLLRVRTARTHYRGKFATVYEFALSAAFS